MVFKLAIIIGTRPEIIRLSQVINKARQLFDVTLIHTGQNYDYNLNQVFFDDLNIKEPEIYLDCSREHLGATVGDIISKTYKIFSETKPDAILVDGDTNSCLSVYSAKRLKIPIFHFEAGHRCFDLNLPEEINRRLVDHLADVNICYTEHARRNLLDENCLPNPSRLPLLKCPRKTVVPLSSFKMDPTPCKRLTFQSPEYHLRKLF